MFKEVLVKVWQLLYMYVGLYENISIQFSSF